MLGMEMSSKQELGERPGKVQSLLRTFQPFRLQALFHLLSPVQMSSVSQPRPRKRFAAHLERNMLICLFLLFSSLGIVFLISPFGKILTFFQCLLEVSAIAKNHMIFSPSQTDVISCSSEHLKICTVLLSTSIVPYSDLKLISIQYKEDLSNNQSVLTASEEMSCL